MTLDAQSLTHYQGCKRRHRLSLEWQPRRWQPKSLFNHCLKHAIMGLCGGKTAQDAAQNAKTELLELAGDPGMDTVAFDPYALAKDYCALLDAIVRSEQRRLSPDIPRLTLIPDLPLSESCSWKFSSVQDEFGNLHRWLTWDVFSDDRLARELHGWSCFGDIAMSGKPMYLHIISVGRLVLGRQETPWARAYHTVHFPSKIIFKPKKMADYEKVWLAQTQNHTPDEWVDAMWKQKIAQTLVRQIKVIVPPEKVCEDTKRQILIEHENMQTITTQKPYQELPMSRNSCSGNFQSCPYQTLCYRENPVEPHLISEIGMYTPKTNGT